MKGASQAINIVIMLVIMLICVLFVLGISGQVKSSGNASKDNIEFERLCAQWYSSGCKIELADYFKSNDGKTTIRTLCGKIYDDTTNDLSVCTTVCVKGCIPAGG